MANKGFFLDQKGWSGAYGAHKVFRANILAWPEQSAGTGTGTGTSTSTSTGTPHFAPLPMTQWIFAIAKHPPNKRLGIGLIHLVFARAFARASASASTSATATATTQHAPHTLHTAHHMRSEMGRRPQ
ncbi:hypothetical protein E4U53_002271 [Claviceps sorghi]|nr:hypothetical protein E4U53_002271 [Claviceps sorghi]